MRGSLEASGGCSQVMGFSMAYLEVGLKEEDFNGLPGGWSQVRSSLLAYFEDLQRLAWRLVSSEWIFSD
jgi:hypothetical protein